MRKFIQSRSTWEIAMVSVLSLFATVGVVMAATTIGTNITTGGAIYATSTLYVDGASTFTNTVTASAANLKVSTGYGLDSTGAVLNIGTTTATTINIGSLTGTTAIGGNLTFPTAYGLDSTGAVLNIGTTTATTINIGSLTGITAAGGRITVPTGYGLDTAAASGILNIGTTTATTINIGSLTGTTAIGGNLTFPTAYGLDSTGAVLNIGTTTATTINIGSLTGITAAGGRITVPKAYGLDVATAGVLNIGTSTATQVNIGSASAPVVMANASSTLANFGSGTTVSGLVWGTCAVNPQSITAATSSAVATSCSATGVTSSYKVFVTPPNDGVTSDDNWLVLKGASASTTDSFIEITLFNASTTAAIDGSSKTWSWMAIK